MKKALIILLSLTLIFTLTACGEKSGGDPRTSGAAPSEASGASYSEPVQEEVKVYGIGEAAEANGLSITIDKVTAPDPDIFYNKAKEGFAFMQVYYTFKNVSDETIETPKRQAIYIVYKEVPQATTAI